MNIAIIEALAKGFVPEVIQRLKSGNRYIHPKITVLGTIHIGAAIARGDFDFGIMLNPQGFLRSGGACPKRKYSLDW